LSHLEQRMRQSGHWEDGDPLAVSSFERLVAESIGSLDVDQARQEVLPFVRQPEALEVWSREFFTEIVKRIKTIEIKKRAS
ncbi:MAG: nucleotidyl transferase AbiEii/AbiGii toxin family protein, partial [Deltaproteobacteria bacterium]|nr:nucleotidyl transferase AbiEii/AbiGii toxin family protein [Deltaproteobacteria bacterium]